MRTIIHIGQHKTGTTSIQHYLKKNKAALAEQGLYVPNSIVGFRNTSNVVLHNPSQFILSVYSLARKRQSPMKENLFPSKSRFFYWSLGKKIKSDIALHYQRALDQGCKDIIWSNEGLYLLNSFAEYKKLINLFSRYSSEIVVVCCFRDPDYFRTSYCKQLQKRGLRFSQNPDSYRYVEKDSWLFDYARKRKLLNDTFDQFIDLSYDPDDMVNTFMSSIEYSAPNSETFRLNVTKVT